MIYIKKTYIPSTPFIYSLSLETPFITFSSCVLLGSVGVGENGDHPSHSLNIWTLTHTYISTF